MNEELFSELSSITSDDDLSKMIQNLRNNPKNLEAVNLSVHSKFTSEVSSSRYDESSILPVKDRVFDIKAEKSGEQQKNSQQPSEKFLPQQSKNSEQQKCRKLLQLELNGEVKAIFDQITEKAIDLESGLKKYERIGVQATNQIKSLMKDHEQIGGKIEKSKQKLKNIQRNVNEQINQYKQPLQNMVTHKFKQFKRKISSLQDDQEVRQKYEQSIGKLRSQLNKYTEHYSISLRQTQLQGEEYLSLMKKELCQFRERNQQWEEQALQQFSQLQRSLASLISDEKEDGKKLYEQIDSLMGSMSKLELN